MRAESVASSRIEGLVVGGRRLLRADAARQLGEEVRDVTAAEILANIDAMVWGVAAVAPGGRITMETLLEAHRRLMAASRLQGHGGSIHTVQNWIGGSGHNPCSAAFVPPPPEEVPALLDDLLAFCNDDGLSPLAQATIAHAQFETIHKIDRSTVMRIRNKARPKQKTGANADDFPAPDIPRHERWPVTQLISQTGVSMTADDARWLADMGQCYEAEGCEGDLMYAIGAASGESIRDPWAYIQRCVANRGDAWTVSRELLSDVLTWAGQQSLEYALCAIGGGYVRRPRAYLQRTLQRAVASGKGPKQRDPRRGHSGGPLSAVGTTIDDRSHKKALHSP